MLKSLFQNGFAACLPIAVGISINYVSFEFSTTYYTVCTVTACNFFFQIRNIMVCKCIMYIRAFLLEERLSIIIKNARALIIMQAKTDI